MLGGDSVDFFRDGVEGEGGVDQEVEETIHSVEVRDGGHVVGGELGLSVGVRRARYLGQVRFERIGVLLSAEEEHVLAEVREAPQGRRLRGRTRGNGQGHRLGASRGEGNASHSASRERVGGDGITEGGRD